MKGSDSNDYFEDAGIGSDPFRGMFYFGVWEVGAVSLSGRVAGAGGAVFWVVCGVGVADIAGAGVDWDYCVFAAGSEQSFAESGHGVSVQCGEESSVAYGAAQSGDADDFAGDYSSAVSGTGIGDGAGAGDASESGDAVRGGVGGDGIGSSVF